MGFSCIYLECILTSNFVLFFHLFILIISSIYFYFKMWDKIMKMTFCQ